MYATENEFSKYFTAKLKKSGIRITRIESHSTGNGIPDMYIDGHGFDCFIELKNDNELSIHDEIISIKWRPGQQAWMYEYFLKHRKSRCCLTIVACSDGWFIIPMTKVYRDNEIHCASNFSISYDDLKRINLCRMLHLMSTHFMYENDTFRTAIIAMVDTFWHNTGIDYCTEVLWDYSAPDNSIDVDEDFDELAFEAGKLEMFLILENTMINID